MFTGIVEALGQVKKIETEGSNVHFWLTCPFTSELKVDQSLAHNGVCLTVVEIIDDQYKVTAIEETIQKTNLSDLLEGKSVNLERCMPANGRFDGHIVQGHIDQTAKVMKIEERDGSWNFHFSLESSQQALIVEKGSITVNGTSLTVVDVSSDIFSVSIIPYTYEHTVFKDLSINDRVNIEFDILGKYAAAAMKNYAAVNMRYPD